MTQHLLNGISDFRFFLFDVDDQRPQLELSPTRNETKRTDSIILSRPSRLHAVSGPSEDCMIIYNVLLIFLMTDTASTTPLVHLGTLDLGGGGGG